MPIAVTTRGRPLRSLSATRYKAALSFCSTPRRSASAGRSMRSRRDEMPPSAARTGKRLRRLAAAHRGHHVPAGKAHTRRADRHRAICRPQQFIVLVRLHPQFCDSRIPPIGRVR
eukprot:6345892-Prymnesium_polylepis.1